jgi:hypothetical protein
VIHLSFNAPHAAIGSIGLGGFGLDKDKVDHWRALFRRGFGRIPSVAFAFASQQTVSPCRQIDVYFLDAALSSPIPTVPPHSSRDNRIRREQMHRLCHDDKVL